MLPLIAEFAATLTNPLAVGLVLLAACVLPRPMAVRAAGALAGALLAAPELIAGRAGEDPLALGLVLLGGLAAGLLQAEICLHIVLPAWRLAAAVTAWLLAAVRLLLARLAALAGSSPGSDR